MCCFGVILPTFAVYIRVWTNVVRKGDVVVDATCGNGYDTLAMLRLVADDELQIGRVYAMDLQKDALESTSSFLDKSVSPHKVLACNVYCCLFLIHQDEYLLLMI